MKLSSIFQQLVAVRMQDLNLGGLRVKHTK